MKDQFTTELEEAFKYSGKRVVRGLGITLIIIFILLLIIGLLFSIPVCEDGNDMEPVIALNTLTNIVIICFIAWYFAKINQTGRFIDSRSGLFTMMKDFSTCITDDLYTSPRGYDIAEIQELSKDLDHAFVILLICLIWVFGDLLFAPFIFSCLHDEEFDCCSCGEYIDNLKKNTRDFATALFEFD